jgi:hypothetical protein
MRNRQSQVFLVLALSVFFAAMIGFDAGAKQQTNDIQPTAFEGAIQDGPVAITPKTTVEKGPPEIIITPEDFGNFRFPLVNNKGDIVFLGLFSKQDKTNGAGQSIFVRHPDGSWNILKEGEKAGNWPHAIHGFGMPTFNDNGDLTFFSSFGAPAVAPTTITDPNDPAHVARPSNGALYLKNAQGLKMLVKLGDEVPKMPSHFSGFSNASTNSKGVTAFVGMYSDPDGKGIFLIENGELRLLVRSGQKVGIIGGEETFSEHYYPTQINEQNELAFLARIGEKSGIFLSRPKGLELIAFVGRPSPVKGTNYLGFGNRPPAINNKGDVAFSGFYDGPTAGRALFFKPANGPVQVVAKKGDLVPGAGKFEDFLSPAVNSHGEIAFIGLLGGRNRGMFIKTAKGIETIALVDHKIPGAKDELDLFNQFTQPAINDRGEVVFYGQIKNNVAIFHRDDKGVLHTLVRRGDKMPK